MTYYCGECGKECDWQDLDYGYGVTEFWGAVNNHVNLQRVSTCCEGDLYVDDELEQIAEFKHD